jgi:hypothetical protein
LLAARMVTAVLLLMAMEPTTDNLFYDPAQRT